MKKLLTGLIFSILALTAAVVYNADSKVEAAYYSQAVGAAIKNRIINGNMAIAQRGVSFVPATSDAYQLDRFKWFVSTSTAVATITQDTSSQPPTTYGLFRYSAKIAITTADNSTDPNDLVVYSQTIEAYNSDDFIGSALNKGFTLSFWVRDTVTGTHCVSFQNAGQDKSYIATYTVSATNTWEFKTVSVSASTTGGTWGTGTAAGLRVYWPLQVGSNNQAAANAWQDDEVYATSSVVNSCSTIGNIFQLTGVQLEVGPNATAFENRLFTQELAFAQRYCWVYESVSGENNYVGTGVVTSTSIGQLMVQFPVPMRIRPIFAATASEWSGYDGGLVAALTTFSAYTGNSQGGQPNSMLMQCAQGGTNWTIGRSFQVLSTSGGIRRMVFNADF